MRARFLSKIFCEALIAAAAMPMACGGQVASGEATDGGADTPNADASPDGGDDTEIVTDVGIDVGPTCDTIGKPKETDPIPPCGYQLQLVGDPNACGFDPISRAASPDTCRRLCGHSAVSICWYYPGPAGSTAYVECGGACEGRRPDDLAPCAPRGDAVGRWLAQIAYLEAASIDAFRTLRAELRAHRAPKRLLHATSRARRDEVRHARTTRALARRYGGASKLPTTDASRVRSLEAIATENAIEGCVRETYGALVAMHRAKHAVDPVVRAEMRRIARDETRHAALAWAIARWIRPRLDTGARTRVDEAQRRAVDSLRGEVESLPAAIARATGTPDRDRALALLDAVANRLWS
jgi:hypothetical protein